MEGSTRDNCMLGVDTATLEVGYNLINSTHTTSTPIMGNVHNKLQPPPFLTSLVNVRDSCLGYPKKEMSQLAKNQVGRSFTGTVLVFRRGGICAHYGGGGQYTLHTSLSNPLYPS